MALASLSVLQWADMRIPEALASGERAVQLLETRGDSIQRFYALTFLGTLLVNIDREPEALAVLGEALAMAERTGFRQFDAVIRIFRGAPGCNSATAAGWSSATAGWSWPARPATTRAS